MCFMDWKILNGCVICCLVLNYYLILIWLGEVKDDLQLCLINECVYVNIQKDGIYLVVLWMWGGVINVVELWCIVDVVDKYQVLMVKVIGGQCIDLLGVKKDDLLVIWKDFDMFFGYVYGKFICIVKICVGSEFCCFGM